MSEIKVIFDNNRKSVTSGDSWVYTDSLNLAKVLEYDHKRVLERIRKVIKDYKIEDGHFNCPSSDATEASEFINNNTYFKFSEVFYKNKQNKLQPYYKMSKDLLMLVIPTFTKIPKAKEIQLSYIAKFNEMERELHWWRARYLGIDVRNSLTDAIKEYLENPKWYDYANFTDIVYEVLFNKKAKVIKQEKGLKSKANVREFLNEDCLELVKALENEMGVLLSYGFSQNKIKSLMEKKHTDKYELVLK